MNPADNHEARTRLYRIGERSPIDLDPQFSAHMAAMTGEGLESKADIAMELAARDAHIADLEAALAAARGQADGTGIYHGLDTARRVCCYEHEFYVLSNFSSFSLRWKGLDFPTSEHAYHWEKFADTAPDIAETIRTAPSAHEAFKLAQQHKDKRRADWDTVKLDIMRSILRTKAQQHAYVLKKLIETGDRLIVEDSWRDDFWGEGPDGQGLNWLGRLWMKVRAEYRAAGY